MNINTLEPNVNNNYLTAITTVAPKSKTSDTADNYISDNKNVSPNVDSFSLSDDSFKETGIYSPNEFINSNYEVSTVNDITPYAVTSKTLNFKSGYAQEKTKWCAVACTASVLKYFGVTKTQSEVYKEAKNTTTVENEGINFKEAKAVLKEFANKTFTTSTNPTFRIISSKIDNGNIVMIRGSKNNNTVDHALICYGFTEDSDNKTYTLKVFDPSQISGGYGTLTCSKAGSSDYTLTVGSNTTTYNASEFIYGN